MFYVGKCLTVLVEYIQGIIIVVLVSWSFTS